MDVLHVWGLLIGFCTLKQNTFFALFSPILFFSQYMYKLQNTAMFERWACNSLIFRMNHKPMQCSQNLVAERPKTKYNHITLTLNHSTHFHTGRKHIARQRFTTIQNYTYTTCTMISVSKAGSRSGYLLILVFTLASEGNHPFCFCWKRGCCGYEWVAPHKLSIFSRFPDAGWAYVTTACKGFLICMYFFCSSLAPGMSLIDQVQFLGVYSHLLCPADQYRKMFDCTTVSAFFQSLKLCIQVH